MDSKQLQIMVEDYVMDLKKRVNPNSIPTYVNPLQTFLDAGVYRLYNPEYPWMKIVAYVYSDVNGNVILGQSRN